ncbi:MAG: hypothetical protein APR54_05505 [Candidatus Cloacimonas sp. SDB]|nr:MAG: hypothetical protein APR54_05505 [Candidatus Cloacimonas sp. SDB]
MKNELIILNAKEIQSRIITLQNEQIMIDRDLAELYGVETKVLNQAVKRNIDRFPNSFRFQLNNSEKEELVTNCDRFKNLKHSASNPYAFTEQGVAMLSAVLRSKAAVQVSIQIIDAFVIMRRFLASNAAIFQRLDSVEKKQLEHKTESDRKFNQIFNAIEEYQITPKQGIFFDGQIFNAYKLLSDIFRSAVSSIFIIDNYIDDSILTLLSKRDKNVTVKIFSGKINSQLKLDVQKYNEQYPSVELIKLTKAHDRFIIIDEKHVYHLGASLKDLGNKWFAFTKMDNDGRLLIDHLKGLCND